MSLGMPNNPPRLELKNISKSFFGVPALKNVSFVAQAGEVVGLCGENGAGKSTLMKVLSGVWATGSFEGKILIDGQQVFFRNPAEALAAGVSIVHQELSVFDQLSIAENFFIYDFPTIGGIVQQSLLESRASEILAKLQAKISPHALAKDLSVGQKQLVEIGRALTQPLRILILDEPTSALTDPEIENLHQVVLRLKNEGVCILYISHKMEELEKICQRVVVLRDGESVWASSMTDWSRQKVVEAMVGRPLANLFPPKRPLESRGVLLEIEDLCVTRQSDHRALLNHIHFQVRRGEIFGIAGLMGSGRTELVSAIFGALSNCHRTGRVIMNGVDLSKATPAEAIQSGLALLTEDRKLSGLFLDHSVRQNLSLPILRSLSRLGVIHEATETETVSYFSKILRVKSQGLEAGVRTLSGGNQQKVLLGRWLATKPTLMILDEPTRGIDVGAKAEIYFLMRELVDQGLTLLLVSSELPEIVGLCDRVLVMREGHMSGILEGPQVEPIQIMKKAVGDVHEV